MSGARKNRRNRPPVTFPRVSRDIVGLFSASPEYADRLTPVTENLFRNPRFSVILPGLGLLAVRTCGSEHAMNQAALLQEQLQYEIPFDIVSTELIKKDARSLTVEARIDAAATAALNQERLKAQNLLGGSGIDEFRGIAIAKAGSVDEAVHIQATLENVLSSDPEACKALLLPAKLGHKTNK